MVVFLVIFGRFFENPEMFQNHLKSILYHFKLHTKWCEALSSSMRSKGPLRAKSGVRVLKVYLRVRCIQISATRNQMKVCLHKPPGISMILKIENSKIVGVTNLTGVGGSTSVIFRSFLVDFSKISKFSRFTYNRFWGTLNFT